MYLISGALRLLFVQYAKGRVKKFMLGKLVDFSIKWVGGLWIWIYPNFKIFCCDLKFCCSKIPFKNKNVKSTLH